MNLPGRRLMCMTPSLALLAWIALPASGAPDRPEPDAPGTTQSQRGPLRLPAPTFARTTEATISRGPYLQSGTPTSVVVRWRTDTATDSGVWYGTNVSSLTSTAVDKTSTTEHVVTLSGLSPDTRYYYAIGTSTTKMAGGTADFFVATAPNPGTRRPVRIWVIGDSGTSSPPAVAVRDGYYGFANGRPTDLWLMLGDNAYPDGTDEEYQFAVFNMYSEILRNSVVWSTMGNHDGHSAQSATESGPYYDIFTFPRQGEAGGVPSGTEAYYAFDYANIHFVCLDSTDSDRSVDGAMMTWLKEDVAATNQDWVVAFWHHPPYSKGSHDSDEEGALIDMREVALPILEAAGVDLVLAGHSHAYERTYLLDGHYGTSDTLTPSMILDPGNGREDGDGAYRKSSSGMAAHEGAVYAVAGNSGQVSEGSLDHPAMYVSLRSLGSMVLDIDGDRLDAKELNSEGDWPDYFTIVKGVGVIPVAPDLLTATAVSSSEIDLSWRDNTPDEVGFRVDRSTDGIEWMYLTTVAAEATAFTDEGVEAGTTYYYRVRASTTYGDSPYSSTASATTEEAGGCGSLMRTAGGSRGVAGGAGVSAMAAGLVLALRRRARR